LGDVAYVPISGLWSGVSPFETEQVLLTKKRPHILWLANIAATSGWAAARQAGGTFLGIAFLVNVGCGSADAKRKSCLMQIRAGYEISYDCPQPTPMIAMLSVHPSRIADLLTLDRMRLEPQIIPNTY
jgi:hypothetical protein